MCRWAQQQRCSRIPSCGANCNLNCAHPWDWRNSCRPPACPVPKRTCRPPHRPGCAALHRYAQRHNLTFFASETILHRDADRPLELCSEFRHVALVRHPVERVRRQLERMSTQPNSRFRAMLSTSLVFNLSERTSLMGTPSLDNYLTRLLLGPDAFFLPFRALTDVHCDQASALLAGFVAAVPLERLDGAGAAHIASLLGWSDSPSHRNAHQKGSIAGRALPAPAPDGAQRRLSSRPPSLAERYVRQLHLLNRCDLRLYDEATRRFASQLHDGARARRSAEPIADMRAPCADHGVAGVTQCPLG